MSSSLFDYTRCILIIIREEVEGQHEGKLQNGPGFVVCSLHVGFQSPLVGGIRCNEPGSYKCFK